jgi:hypothetical protein
MLIIGISGKMNAGKDTLADMLIGTFSVTHPEIICKKYSFARVLKNIAGEAFGVWDPSLFDSREFKKSFNTFWKATNRELLQKVGTAFRETFGTNFWVKRLFGEIASQQPDIAFISDVRYKSEVEGIESAGGLVIRVNRDFSDGSESEQKHTSETELDDYKGFSFIVKNDGSLEDLSVKATELNASISKLDKFLLRNDLINNFDLLT